MNQTNLNRWTLKAHQLSRIIVIAIIALCERPESVIQSDSIKYLQSLRLNDVDVKITMIHLKFYVAALKDPKGYDDFLSNFKKQVNYQEEQELLKDLYREDNI